MKWIAGTVLLSGLALAQNPGPIHPPKGQEINDIPGLGLGTWYLKGNTTEVIASAIANGYRHLDLAWIYDNQVQIGPGIKEGMKRAGIDRKDLWITSKLWNSQHSNAAAGLKVTLDQLGLDYLDLFLIHWPIKEQLIFNSVDTTDIWRSMEKLVGKGTRFIGVANFSPKQLKQVLNSAKIKPKAVQIELHPYLPQSDYVKSIQDQGMSVIAYSPLGNTNPNYSLRDRKQHLLDHAILKEIAQQRGCTPAQVSLAWNMRRKVIPIPKAAKVSHQKENLEVEKCKLVEEDIKKIEELSKPKPFRFNGDLCEDRAQATCWEGLAMPNRFAP